MLPQSIPDWDMVGRGKYILSGIYFYYFLNIKYVRRSIIRAQPEDYIQCVKNQSTSVIYVKKIVKINATKSPPTLGLNSIISMQSAYNQNLCKWIIKFSFF